MVSDVGVFCLGGTKSPFESVMANRVYLPILTCVSQYVFRNLNQSAYYERIDAIPKYQGPSTPSNEMIVNTEWGSFGDDHRSFLPLTRYDNALNRQSSNPGVHIYEKMISGLYLGEIVRQAMIDLLDRRFLFAGPGGQQELGKYSRELNTPYSFETSYAGQIEQDATPELEETKHILESVLGLGDGTTTLTDRRMVKKLCEVVGIRAARLCAAGMAGVINKIGAVEGGGVTISEFFLLFLFLVEVNQDFA